MNNIFGMINLAGSLIAGVSAIRHLVALPGPISGEALAAQVQPSVSALVGVVPKLVISSDLVLDCCNAIAGVVNAGRK